MFFDFINSEMTAQTLQDFLSAVYMDRSVTVSGPRSAANLLLVHSDCECSFSSNDLSWLGFAGHVLIGKTAFGYDLFCLEVNCAPAEYYTVCAALIKLFNQAFTQKKLFLFRMDSAAAFGCKRDLDWDVPGNFCVTERFDLSPDSEILDFLTELPLTGAGDLPWLVMKYSPQERSEPVNRFYGTGPDLDYLQFLQEFSSLYGVDTTSESEWYLSQFERRQSGGITYQDAKEMLSDIGNTGENSSYEVLDAAIEAEKRSRAVQTGPEAEPAGPLWAQEGGREFSPEAYLNAEIMLDEILHSI